MFDHFLENAALVLVNNSYTHRFDHFEPFLKKSDPVSGHFLSKLGVLLILRDRHGI